MNRRLATLVPVLACLACGSANFPADTVDGPGVAAYVIDARDLHAAAPLWASLRDRVPGMRAFDGVDGCPAVTLRRGRRASPITAPLVYVDGTRTSGTCALEYIAARDVDRVEVYPGGVSHRPGYRTHATGLILIFLRTG